MDDRTLGGSIKTGQTAATRIGPVSIPPIEWVRLSRRRSYRHLMDPTVAITGATSGIGRAVAEAF
ncbi:hypothetical protein ACFQDD_05565, partial [Halorubrum pallidum]